MTVVEISNNTYCYLHFHMTCFNWYRWQWLKSAIIHTVTYIFRWLVLTGIDDTVVEISNNTYCYLHFQMTCVNWYRWQWLKSAIIHTVTYIFRWLVLTGIDATVTKLTANGPIATKFTSWYQLQLKACF